MIKTSIRHEIISSRGLPTVLIAGGAGFIGAHLCQLLLEQNCHVFCLDNLLTGKKENIKAFLSKKNFHFINHDLTQPLEEGKFSSFDYIFHLAGIESYFLKGEISLQTLVVNSLGTRNLLDLSKKQKSKFLLASSPCVFEGLISSKELETYFGKKEDSQSFYSLAEAKRFSESLVFEYFKNYDLDCRIVRLADVYGPGMPLEANNEIAILFNNLRKEEPLKIPGKGEKIIFPTFIDDLVYGLLKAMFDQNSMGKIYALANSQEINLLDFAHKLKEISGTSLGIEFVAPVVQLPSLDKKELLKSQRELNWYPKVGLEEGIKKTLTWLQGQPKEKEEKVTPKTETAKVIKEEKVNELKKPVEEKIKREKVFHKALNKIKKIKSRKIKIKNLSRKALALVLILLFLISSLPVFSLIYYFKKGIKQMEKGQNSSAILSFQKSKKVLLEFNWLTAFPPLKNQREEVLSILNLGTHILEAEQQKKEAISHLNNLIEMVVKGQRGDAQEEARGIKIHLDQSYQDLSLVESELNGINLETNKGIILGKLKDRLKSFRQELPDLRKKTALFRDGLNILPELLAFKEKKTYLVLLQDNTELRPTGGFINSFALLTFEKGKLLDFEVESVDKADSQLKGRVEPPEAIKKYLGENNWYLRDANWNPDFPSTASQAEWFLDKEIGRATDGTIGLTLNFLQEVLKELGPVQLLNYDEIINADNLFERAIYYSQLDLSSGSGEKDFLGQLFTLLGERIRKMEVDDWLKFAKAIDKGLVEKQLLVSLHDKKTNRFFRENGWDGAIRQSVSNQDKLALNDYLMLIESNLGVNKVNYFVRRNLKQEITILEEGELIESFTLTLDNNNSSQSRPGGEYKNYLRLYTPLKSQLIKLEIGENEKSLFTITEAKVDQFAENGKQVFAVLVAIPAQEKRIVKFTYKLQDKLKFKNNEATYLCYWQKQPGVSDEEIEFQLNFPEFFKPMKVAPLAKLSKTQLNFSSNIDKDNAFLVEFKR